jgi:hypothetical protein
MRTICKSEAVVETLEREDDGSVLSSSETSSSGTLNEQQQQNFFFFSIFNIIFELSTRLEDLVTQRCIECREAQQLQEFVMTTTLVVE